MEEQEKVMYEYIGIDPSVYIKDVVDASNAKEFLLYLDEMESEELKKIAFVVLIEIFCLMPSKKILKTV